MKKKTGKVFDNLFAVSALQDGDRETGTEGIGMLNTGELICDDIVLQRELNSEMLELVLRRRLPRWESRNCAKTPRVLQHCLQIRCEQTNKGFHHSRF